jgi:hypothetical protein
MPSHGSDEINGDFTGIIRGNDDSGTENPTS